MNSTGFYPHNIQKIQSELLNQMIDNRHMDKKIWRANVVLKNLNLLKWLEKINLYPKFFWSDPLNQNTFATAGSVSQFKGQRWPGYTSLSTATERILHNSHPELRLYGGLRFNPGLKSSPEWQKFGTYQFVIPTFEIWQTSQNQILSYNYFVNQKKEEQQRTLEDLLNQWNYNNLPWKRSLRGRWKQRTDFPEQQGWTSMVQNALDLLQKDALKKIVLAKRSIFQFSKPIESFTLFNQLRNRYSNSFFFFFQLNPDLTFMGVSPELLYMRQGNKIFTEALAGTRPRGKNRSEDQKFEMDLKRNVKEQREHRWVSKEIEKNLREICSEWYRLSTEEVIKLSFVQHLQTRFEGTLKENMMDGQILEVFHPTPAVAGLPREYALQRIQLLEKFDRGWYAGPIGWLSRDQAAFAVALRSALIWENEALIYGGSGIVKGSEPAKEWQEIENKLMNFTNIFSGL